MPSVRLRADQIVKLEKSPNASAMIRFAVKRWRRGDFVIKAESADLGCKGGLLVFPIWKKPDGVSNSQLRMILDAHWENPCTQFDREVAYWDRVIAEEMAKISNIEFVVENNDK